MIIGVLAEARPGETRVAATPATVVQLMKLGYEVVVDPGAGAASDFPDDSFVAAGASIGAATGADLVFGVNAPAVEQLDAMREGTTLVCLMAPGLNPDLVSDLARRGITALAMDAVPRISRAQSLDVLSSMANIAGYRAVIEAANVFGRFFTGQVTAAGQGAAGEGARRGRGGGRPGRHRRGRQPRGDRAGGRPAPRGRRPGEVPRRGVPRGAGRRRRGQRHRLCQGDVRRLQPARRRALRRAVQGRRHHHHHRADSRAGRRRSSSPPTWSPACDRAA